MRNGTRRIWIISAHRATKHEQDVYFRQNAPCRLLGADEPDGTEEAVPVDPLAPMSAARDRDAPLLTEADLPGCGGYCGRRRCDAPSALGTLRDWEQGRTEPDKSARAYLTVIARSRKRAPCAAGCANARQVKSEIRRAW